jgi:hypothetical protein
MRKIIIGLASLTLVGLTFWGYVWIMESPLPPPPAETQTGDLPLPETKAGSGNQTSQTIIHSAQQSRYVILDPATKEPWRVLGFEKLLNPEAGSSRWKVEKPYLIFYEPGYHCRVESDTGTFQVETAGADAAPKDVRDAQLRGNVLIHIVPQPGGGISDTFIHMNDLTFSSERSEFATDGPVSVVSDQIQLDGFGLILIFDAAKGRIEYMHIRDLEKLRLINMASSESTADTVKPTRPARDAGPPKGVSPQAPRDARRTPAAAKSQKAPSVSRSDYYRCILDNNVVIHYGDQLIVTGADQVTVQNVLFSNMNQTADAKKLPPTDTKADIAEPILPKPRVSRAAKIPSVPTIDEKNRDVVVLCDGGIILRPMQEVDSMPTEPRSARLSVETSDTSAGAQPLSADVGIEQDGIQSTDLKGTVRAVSQPEPPALPYGDGKLNSSEPPARFEARQIDYDLQTGSGLALGPVRFTFFQPADPNSDVIKPWIPVAVTADKDAEFVADMTGAIEQVIFNQNVLAVRRTEKPDSVQLDSFHGDKLTVYPEKGQTGSMDIRRISMTESKVFAESVRMQGDIKLSHVKLNCIGIEWDRMENALLAAGPGKIELVANEESPLNTPEQTGVNFRRPCVAQLVGFDTIRWLLTERKITADGNQETMQLVYVPLFEGKPEKFIYVNSMQFNLLFAEDAAGRTVLEKVFTDQGIIYRENNADQTETLHELIGQTLNYDAQGAAGWLAISGTDANPCSVDGSRVPAIRYNLNTGQLETSLSTIPGVLNSVNPGF